jgi:hypothetical protein
MGFKNGALDSRWKKGLEKFPFAMSTMKDFLTLYDKHFPSLQEAQFFLFQEGIFPEWEAPENISGGR